MDAASERNGQPATGEQAEWVVRANRIAPLVDGAGYYRHLRDALTGARQQVLMVGWELHSEIDLLRGDNARQARDESRWPVRLADLLHELVEERETLEIRLLMWPGASLFALERQHLPRMKRPWAEHPRIILVWDDDTPSMASHHQKLVVIDDRVAFAGGMDLTKSRWDDHSHAIDDKRRRVPGLWPRYGSPYHDLMLAVDGEAARALGAWARERWRRATGDTLDVPEAAGAGPDEPWPDGLRPLLENREVSMALTQPDYGGRPEKRQIESSFMAQFAAARSLIFIETQYLTSSRLVDALCDRLREEDGPEVVLILPYGCPGSLQSVSMDPPRDALLDRLREADPGGRFGVYWATLDAGGTRNVFARSVYIHAKVMIVDDRLLRIGSANLNNRSMGLDTELDLWVSTKDEEADAVEAIAGFRRRLLSYLLHVEDSKLARAEAQHGSVVAAIECLRGGTRTLHAFDHRAESIKHVVPLPVELADPDRPLSDLDAGRVLEAIDSNRRLSERAAAVAARVIGVCRRWQSVLLVVAAALLLALVWNHTPIQDIIDRKWLEGTLKDIRSGEAGIIGVIAAFAMLAAIGFPVTLLIVVIGAMFGVGAAIGICVIGVLISALADFALGRLAPSLLPSPLEGVRRHGIVERLRGRGVLAVAIIRNLPIAPFAVVNMGCGAAGLAWWRYALGTLIGMLPGIVLVSLFGSEIGGLLTDPTPANIAKVVLAAALVIGLAALADTLLRRYGEEIGERDGGEAEQGDIAGERR